eukprot:2700600-Prymnesium_polylepis.1
MVEAVSRAPALVDEDERHALEAGRVHLVHVSFRPEDTRDGVPDLVMQRRPVVLGDILHGGLRRLVEEADRAVDVSRLVVRRVRQVGAGRRAEGVPGVAAAGAVHEVGLDCDQLTAHC